MFCIIHAGLRLVNEPLGLLLGEGYYDSHHVLPESQGEFRKTRLTTGWGGSEAGQLVLESTHPREAAGVAKLRYGFNARGEVTMARKLAEIEGAPYSSESTGFVPLAGWNSLYGYDEIGNRSMAKYGGMGDASVAGTGAGQVTYDADKLNQCAINDTIIYQRGACGRGVYILGYETQ